MTRDQGLVKCSLHPRRQLLQWLVKQRCAMAGIQRPLTPVVSSATFSNPLANCLGVPATASGLDTKPCPAVVGDLVTNPLSLESPAPAPDGLIAKPHGGHGSGNTGNPLTTRALSPVVARQSQLGWPAAARCLLRPAECMSYTLPASSKGECGKGR